MGRAIIHKNKIDDSTFWRFERTWIEFKPAINGVMRKAYIPNELADILMDINKFDLYDMFNSEDSELLSYNSVA